MAGENKTVLSHSSLNASICLKKLADIEMEELSICNYRPHDKGSTYLRNIGQFLPDYSTHHPKRQPAVAVGT
jgi:hypothetical protein